MKVVEVIRGGLFLFLSTGGTLLYAEGTSTEPTALTASGITFKPGLRVQTRYSYDDATNNQDFMVRRARFKAKGDIPDVAQYYFEIKIDNVAQNEKTATAKMETVYLDFPLNPAWNLRIGQYDAPFTRNVLTSDSKLLLMERSLIAGELTSLGLADNAQGILAFGRPQQGRYEYCVGLFDNDVFEKSAKDSPKWSRQLMPAARVAVHLFDTPKPGGYADYQESYLGQGKRLSLGTNIISLGDAHDGTQEFSLFAWGVDLSGSRQAWTGQIEYDHFRKDIKAPAGTADIVGSGWYAQAGYMLPRETHHFKLEPCLRVQRLDPNKNGPANRSVWTSVGVNAYRKGHNFKLQLDYTIKKEKPVIKGNNTWMIQWQLDY